MMTLRVRAIFVIFWFFMPIILHTFLIFFCDGVISDKLSDDTKKYEKITIFNVLSETAA